MDSSYDFIIVGAGASGAVLASRLAHTPAAPSILLIEAGGSNSDTAYLSGAERFKVAFAENSPLNWHYKTVPQTHLAGNVIDYSRGKGLGGSTAINFCGWTVGPRDDYDEWADIVGDERFCWENVQNVLKRITNLNPNIPDSRLEKWLHANPKDHSTSGNLSLAYGDAWEPDLGDIYTAAEQTGHRINPDVNSGDPVGMGMGSVCISNGIRGTSASAYLSEPPPNLKIVVDSPVARVLFEGKRAIGIETVDGKKATALKEVILSGGALNTPQILMRSGIGDTKELEKHQIQVVHALPMVGKNLQDHCFTTAGVVLNKDDTLPPGPPQQSPTPMGWFKLPSVTTSSEFEGLPTRVKSHMQKPTVPAMELASHTFLDYEPNASEKGLGAICLIMNPQSRGTVTLQSASAEKPPLIDPKFLTHPFDKRVLIEGVREVMRIQSAPVFAPRILKRIGPKPDDSDDAIFDHIKRNLQSSWHMSCTAAMGKSEEDAVVDGRFKVFGIEGLRVVDLSVCPFVINAHTQSVAYVMGEIGADVLAEEYELGEVRVARKLRGEGR